jgi:hypothetical protein
MAWTDKEIDTLRTMLAQGETYAMVQRFIPNKTRNACIGKARRLGLDTAPRVVVPKAEPAPRKPAAPKVRKAVPILPVKAKPEYVEGPDAAPSPAYRGSPPILTNMPPIEPEPAGPGILLQDLESHHCRWPVNDGNPFRFCGQRKAPGLLSYCSAHLKMHYRHPNAAEVRKPLVKPKVSAFKFRAG